MIAKIVGHFFNFDTSILEKLRHAVLWSAKGVKYAPLQSVHNDTGLSLLLASLINLIELDKKNPHN